MDLHSMVAKVKELTKEKGQVPSRVEFITAGGATDWQLRKVKYSEVLKLAGLESVKFQKIEETPPKVLIFDIETAPILAYVWGLFDQNVGLNQIAKDWHILSWSAKWLGSSEIFYQDQRNAIDIEDDKALLEGIWKLLDEADIVLGQNSQRFDVKKLNARFLHHGMKPPSSFRQIDTMKIAKKYFGFTSNKLAYMSEKFCSQFKKLDHAKFSGFDLWRECMKGNLEAWEEMEKYNRQDILATEELYLRLAPWDHSINFNTFEESFVAKCSACGSKDFGDGGHKFTNNGKFQRYICNNCGRDQADKTNLLSKEKRKALRH